MRETGDQNSDPVSFIRELGLAFYVVIAKRGHRSAKTGLPVRIRCTLAGTEPCGSVRAPGGRRDAGAPYVMLKHLLAFVVILSVLALSACWHGMTPTGPERHESRSIELDKAEKVRVQLNMPVGELDVRGGAQKLMDADFTYNVAAWKPDIRYSSTGPFGSLIVEQHGPTSSSGNAKNRWDLRFNDGVPLDLKVHVGAGEERLNLGSLSLHTVELEMGAGSLHLDLRGNPSKDYSVRIRGGVGEAVVYLPSKVGIAANVSGGIGEISVDGLHKSGDHYVNDAYERAAVRIRLDIQGGVGSIRLIAD